MKIRCIVPDYPNEKEHDKREGNRQSEEESDNRRHIDYTDGVKKYSEMHVSEFSMRRLTKEQS